MPDSANHDLIAAIAMLFAMLTSSIGCSLLARLGNNYRDEVRLGVKNGMPLSLKHRWDILTGDWLILWTIVSGTVAFVGFGLLQLARLSENEGVRLLGYAGAFGHAWGLLMMLIFIPIEAVTLLKHLKSLRQAEAD